MEDTGKVIEIMKKIGGVDIRRMWVVHDEDFREIFDWFAKIDDDNIITDTLDRDYEELKRHDDVHEESELDAMLKELDTQYANILDYTDRDVAELEQQLEQMVEIEEHYERLMEDVKKTDILLTKELTEMERATIDAQYLMEKKEKSCLALAKRLEEKQLITQQKIADLHHCYLQPQNPPLFVYQMPLEQFDAKCDQFLKYLQMYVKKHFPVQHLEGFRSSTELSNNEVLDELEDIKARLDVEELKLLEEKREYAGVKHLVDRLEDHEWISMKVSVLKKHSLELKKSNEQDLLRVDLLKTDLEMLIRQMNELRIESVLYETNRSKLDRAISRLEYIQRLDESISKELMNAELLWILMKLDLEKIRNCFNNADEMNAESKKCFKRIDSMKQLEKSSCLEETYSDYLTHLSALIRSATVTDSSTIQEAMENGLKGCLQHFTSLSKRIMKQVESIAKGKYHKKVNSVLEKLSTQEKLLSRFVFDGPLRYPQFYDQEYLERVQQLSFLLGLLERDERSVRKDVVQNIEELKQSQKFKTYKQKLWIWFLTEPKKVTNAIKEITAEASKTASYKSISGIKCKSIVDELKY
ncbi:augmin complex subunit dgt3 [Anopheles aquasalis]|uniref:augmin complex subunit dgt3 n=1 Tax=Anopheles aquasalis TaxID=42839 RepID=UPI00215B35FE|nr:augmin complex subunit dgt3 [Anopheles aquasalis]